MGARVKHLGVGVAGVGVGLIDLVNTMKMN